MKELRQDVARVGNELHPRNFQKISTKKEKRIMKEIGTKIYSKEATSKNIRIVKKEWLDKLCPKKVNLGKYIEKRNRKKHNIMFQRDQSGFFRTLEEVEKCEGEMPGLQRFVKFWGDVWEQNEPMPNMLRMEEVSSEL